MSFLPIVNLYKALAPRTICTFNNPPNFNGFLLTFPKHDLSQIPILMLTHPTRGGAGKQQTLSTNKDFFIQNKIQINCSKTSFHIKHAIKHNPRQHKKRFLSIKIDFD